MEHNVIHMTITGTRPLLMHGDLLSNPLNPITKKHKELTGKKKKTDEDHEAIAKSEWRAGLYYADDIGPYIPDANLEGALFKGGAFAKLGTALRQAIEIAEPRVRLEYDGPRKPDKLWEEGFYDCRSVRVGMKRIMRYRPMFRKWWCSFDVVFDPDHIDREHVIASMTTAGAYIGLGDFRPKFGRFAVEAK